MSRAPMAAPGRPSRRKSSDSWDSRQRSSRCRRPRTIPRSAVPATARCTPVGWRPCWAGRLEPLEALVDTGATYSWIPRGVLEGLGIVPEDQWPFVLADGREVLYPVAWINIRMRGRVQPTIVVFGEPGSEPILGVVTLEEFRVAADPVNRQLISVPGRLKAAMEGLP